MIARVQPGDLVPFFIDCANVALPVLIVDLAMERLGLFVSVAQFRKRFLRTLALGILLVTCGGILSLSLQSLMSSLTSAGILTSVATLLILLGLCGFVVYGKKR